jgi:hypothetical protein
MKVRRVAAGAVALLCALAGVLLIVHGHDLDQRKSSALLAAQKIRPTQASYVRRVGTAALLELRLRHKVQQAKALGKRSCD